MHFRRGLLLTALISMLAFPAQVFAAAPFLTSGNFPVAPGPTSVAVGDFNNDTKLDVVTASGCSSTISVLLGKGNSAFQPAVTTTVGTCLQGVAVGDFNIDGKLDVAVTDGGATGANSVDILLGNGDGTFQAPTAVSVGADPRGIAVGNFNPDGNLDVVTANFSGDSFSVLAGNGDGTFQPAVTTSLAVGSNPIAVAVNDFNFDSNADIVVADHGSNNVSVMLGVGDATFQAAVNYIVGTQPQAIVTGDLNGDLGPELVLSNSDATGTVLFDNRNGNFGPTKKFSMPNGGLGLALADFNGDGNLDLAVGVPGVASQVTILVGRGDGSFSANVSQYAVAGNPQGVAVGDFSGDGKPDVVVACADAAVVSVLPNRGDGTFSAAHSFNGHIQPNFVATGDFNGDGKPDIAVANTGSQDITILLNKSKGAFLPSGNLSLGSEIPNGMTVGDFNNDGKPDLAVNTVNGGGVFLGNGDGTFQPFIPFTNPSGTTNSIAIGEFNHDGKLDLAQTSADTNTVIVRLGNGDGTFQPAQTFPVDLGPVAVIAGKFDAGNFADLVVVDNLANKVEILVGNGDGTFQAATSTGFHAHSPVAVAMGDFNKDGKADLAVADLNKAGELPASIALMLGNGDGTFQVAKRFHTGILLPSALLVLDFNNDRKLDVLVSSGNVNDALLVGNGDGTLQKPSLVIAGENITSLATADFDGNHSPDFVQCNFNSNVGVLLNTQ